MIDSILRGKRRNKTLCSTELEKIHLLNFSNAKKVASKGYKNFKKRSSAVNANLNISILKKIVMNKQKNILQKSMVPQQTSQPNLGRQKSNIEMAHKIEDKATNFKHLAKVLSGKNNQVFSSIYKD